MATFASVRSLPASATSGPIDQWIDTSALQLDRWRCAVLRRSLSWPVLRYLYLHRQARLAMISCFSMAIALLGAQVVPLLMLALGPLLYGVPHLIASVRFVPRETTGTGSGRWLYALLGSALLFVGGSRLAAEWFPGLALFRGNVLELGVMLAVLAGLLGRVRLGGGLVVVMLLISSWLWPAATVGALVLGHNAVAFVYWWRACQSGGQRRLVLISVLGFVLGHALLLSGWELWHLHANWARLDADDLGQLIAPWLADGLQTVSPWWPRLVRCYAFGQAVHYVVWLRLIPEQYLPRPVAVTWRQSLGLLRRDFGRKGTAAVLGSWVGTTVAWLGAASVGRLDLALAAYTAVAAGHGYLEIAGLAARSRPQGEG